MNRHLLPRTIFVLSVLLVFIVPYVPDGQGGCEQGISCVERDDDRDTTGASCPTGPGQ
jgi:hypothetical protein